MKLLSGALSVLAFVACQVDRSSGSNTGGSSGASSASGGAANSSGGATSANGGNNASTGGATNASGGSNAASGGNGASGGSNASSGGAANANGGSSAANGGNATGAKGGNAGNGGATANGGGANANGGSAGAANTGGTSGKAEVRFVGRVDKSDAAGPRFAWSGSGVVARFDGTQVSAKLSSGQFTVLVDGMPQTKVLVANGSMAQLATGLAAGPHTVELYRRTEANQGETQFLGFDFGGGQLLAPPAAPTRHLEIVGDSITCGYGDEGADMNCPFSPETENHYLSYGAIAARNVNAELITVAWSGKGLVYNYGDDASSKVDPMPTYYERTLPERATSQFDFSSWQADAVVVNLGTNDFSTNTDPSQSEFETAYKAFVTRIRSKHPNAWILLTNGSMLSGTDLTTVRTYIKNVVQAVNDPKVKSFEIQPQDAADGYGCDWHPSKKTHVKMADQLTSVLKSTLNW